jgi:hypothetical protein
MIYPLTDFNYDEKNLENPARSEWSARSAKGWGR